MKHKLILKSMAIALIAGIAAAPCSVMAAETGTDEIVAESREVGIYESEPAATQAATELIAKKTDAIDVPLAAETDEKSDLAANNNANQATEPKEKPAAPALSIANGINGLEFSWSKVNNAVHYSVYYKTASDEEWQSFDTDDTRAAFSDAEPGKLYYAKVQSWGADGLEGEFSAVKSMTYIPRAEITSVNFSSNANTITWNSVVGANKYQIAKIKSGDKSYTYYTTTATTFTDRNITNANAYYYQVRAMYATEKNGTAYGAWSSTKSVATLAQASVSLSNKSNGIRAEWGAVSGAERYAVYYKAAEDSNWTTASTTNTYYPIFNVKSGEFYYVQICPVLGNANGTYSKVKSMTFIGVPDVTLSNSADGINVSWKKIEGANKYQIAKKKIGASAYSYFTTEDTSYIDKEVAGGSEYHYQVRAMYATENNGTAYGAWSPSKIILRMTQPDVSLSNKSNGIRAEWGAVSGAERYAVYYKAAEDSKWTTVSTTNTYYPIFNVKSGAFYYVQVCPVAGNVNGTYSKVKSMTFIGVPDVTLSNSADGINVSWKKIEGANKYQIAKKKIGASAYSYFTTEDTSYLDKGVAGGSAYHYQVRAMYATENNGTAYGAWSPSKIILRMTQPVVSLSNKSNGIRAEWKPVSGAERYVVYYKDASAQSWSSVITTNTYYPLLNTKSGTLYYVQVRPAGGGVYGPYSRSKSMTFIGTVNAEPTMSGNSPKFSWSAVSGANKYQIAKKKMNSSSYQYITTTSNFYIDSTVEGSKDFYVYQIRAMYETKNNGTAYGAWSTVYNFGNGKILNGYQTINRYKYYYKNGVLLKNQIVGSKSEGYYLADGNGICCVSEEMHLAAEFIMNCGTGNTLDEKMKTSFKYLAKNFPYKRSYDHPKSKSDIPPLAVDMFKNKAGNCFRYAACFTCIAKICGYRARMAVGYTSNGMPHGWSEVYMDGKWYYFDPDMQLPNYGFPDYYAYKMSNHPWGVSASFRSEVTISNGKAVWN